MLVHSFRIYQNTIINKYKITSLFNQMNLSDLMNYKLFQKKHHQAYTKTIGSQIFIQSHSGSFKIDKNDKQVSFSFSDDSVIYTDKKQKITLRMSIEQSLPIEQGQDEIIELPFNPSGITSYQ